MKASKLATALSTCIAIRRPAFVWGPPGVGKSALVAQVAADLGVGFIDLRAILLDPVDLRGLPFVETVDGHKFAGWATPSFLPRDGRGILFLDELNAAPQSTQAALYQLTTPPYKLGDYSLPPGWTVVAAGNRETDRAVTNRMPSALANRFVHLSLEVDADDWTTWAIKAGVPVELVAFIRFRPELLHKFDPAQKAFPTPRSWQTVGEIFASGPAEAVELDLYGGTVGEGAAAEFCGFLRVYRTLPSVDAIMLDPKRAKVPAASEPATIFALCAALARKSTPANFDRVVEYAARLPREFAVLLVKSAVGRDAALQQTKAFIGWSAANADVLM